MGGGEIVTFKILNGFQPSTKEHKSFSIAPICCLKTTFISICAKKTLKDLYNFVTKTCINKKMHDKFNLNLETLL